MLLVPEWPSCSTHAAPGAPDLAANCLLRTQAEQERQASVIRAEGEAEAAQTISKALEKAGDGLLTIRRIEASKEIAATLSAARNVTYLPSGNGLLLNMQA